MKYITYIDANLFKISNFKLVKHGNYEFTECPDGFTQVFVKTVGDRRNALSNPNALYAYGIYYGLKHPLWVLMWKEVNSIKKLVSY